MKNEFVNSGIPLGVNGESIKPTIDFFERLGITIHPATVHSLRAARYSGVRILKLISYAETLNEGDASRKDEMYLNLATKGIDIRERQRSLTPHRFTSKGFVRRLSNQVGLRTKTIERVAQAMRVDTSLCYDDTNDPRVLEAFKRFYKTYVDHYFHRGRPMRSGFAQNLHQRFGDRGPDSILDFYQFSYGLISGKRTVIATLLPYEVDFFEDFYSWQNKRNNPLTPFDQQALKARLEGTDTKLLEGIRQQTAIPLERIALYYHRLVLAYGTPYSPERRTA